MSKPKSTPKATRLPGRPVGLKPTPKHGTDVVWPSSLAKRYGVSNTTVYRWEQEGKLPTRDAHFDGELVGWKTATIEAFINGTIRGGARSAAA